MAKVKVLVLVPTAFVSLGYPDAVGGDTVEVESTDADTLVGSGWAEKITAKKAAEK